MKKKIDWGEYLFLLAILGYLAYYIWDIRGYAFRAVFWPYCLMGALSVLSVTVGVGVYRGSPPVSETPAAGASPAQRPHEAAPVLLVAMSFAAYALVFKMFGFNLCNLLLTLWLCWVLNKGHLKTAVVTSVCLTASLYLVFGVVLKMRLPTGKLFG